MHATIDGKEPGGLELSSGEIEGAVGLRPAERERNVEGAGVEGRVLDDADGEAQHLRHTDPCLGFADQTPVEISCQN